MKTTLLIAFITNVCFPASLSAQTLILPTDTSGKTIDIAGNFNGADVQLPSAAKHPSSPGGVTAWQDFLRKNINLSVPVSNRAAPGRYTVMVWFHVERDGKIGYAGADSNVGYGLEAEVLRCIRKSPEWMAAETGSGRRVRFTIRQPVTFVLGRNGVEISFR